MCQSFPAMCPCNCPGGGTKPAKQRGYFGKEYADNCKLADGGLDRYKTVMKANVGVYEGEHSNFVDAGYHLKNM